MADAISLGELLIDFVSLDSGASLIETDSFQKAAGGAPANVAVGLSRLGVSVGFLGKVGDDDFGRFLELTLRENGVDTTGLRFSDEARTALAFVALRADGERDFVFFRNPSADMLYTPDEVDVDSIRAASLFHFGSITLIQEPSRSATVAAIEAAHEHGLLVSYDPNLRLNLWPDEEAAREGMMLGWPLAHIIKVSREELAFLSGAESVEGGARQLWHEDLKLLAVTDGAQGCWYMTPEYTGHIQGYAVEAIDTTGAGDGFMAGLLSMIVKDQGILHDRLQLENALRMGNAVGALTTTKRGAIPALPTLEAVTELLDLQL